jgi:hypothetical protein
MPLYQFGSNDIFFNRIKTHPKADFWIYNRKIYYNNRGVDAGSFHSQSLHVEPGYISLYEMNVDRDQNAAGQMIYPFITKDSGISAFKTVATSDFNSGYLYGEQIAGQYPLSASIAIEDRLDTALGHDIRADLTSGRPHILALKNALNSYSYMSPHYTYSSSLGDKGQQHVALVSIPSIFFGSSIKKGTVSLKFYITGTLAAEVQDINRNGELIQVSGTANALGSDYGSGSVAGVVLYNEGFVVLTGSWDISSHRDDYDGDTGVDDTPKWLYFGTSANPLPGGGPSFGGTTRGSTAQESVTSSAWQLTFEGVNYVPVMTMFAHAPRGMLNHSNNPTFKQFGQSSHTEIANTSSFHYVESDNVVVKNVVSSSWEVLTASSNTEYSTNSASFKKQTYISKVGIYDAEKNLIAIAKLAKPIRKTEEDDYTFKLKLDF